MTQSQLWPKCYAFNSSNYDCRVTAFLWPYFHVTDFIMNSSRRISESFVTRHKMGRIDFTGIYCTRQVMAMFKVRVVFGLRIFYILFDFGSRCYYGTLCGTNKLKQTFVSFFLLFNKNISTVKILHLSTSEKAYLHLL